MGNSVPKNDAMCTVAFEDDRTATTHMSCQVPSQAFPLSAPDILLGQAMTQSQQILLSMERVRTLLRKKLAGSWFKT